MTARRVYTPEEVDQIMEGRRNGLTLEQIAKATKIHKSTLQQFLVRMGVEKGGRKKREKPDQSPVEKDNLWSIVASNPVAFLIAQRKPVTPGYKGLLVHQAGRSSIRPKITIFECEKNPGAVPGKRTSGG